MTSQANKQYNQPAPPQRPTTVAGAPAPVLTPSTKPTATSMASATAPRTAIDTNAQANSANTASTSSTRARHFTTTMPTSDGTSNTNARGNNFTPTASYAQARHLASITSSIIAAVDHDFDETSYFGDAVGNSTYAISAIGRDHGQAAIKRERARAASEDGGAGSYRAERNQQAKSSARPSRVAIDVQEAIAAFVPAAGCVLKPPKQSEFFIMFEYGV